jgi:predicted DNA-binding transcriptional regulator AlpA
MNTPTFLRPSALGTRWGMSGSSIRRMAREGRLPRPVQISERIFGWSLETIQKLEAERDRAAAAKTAKKVPK